MCLGPQSYIFPVVGMEGIDLCFCRPVGCPGDEIPASVPRGRISNPGKLMGGAIQIDPTLDTS